MTVFGVDAPGDAHPAHRAIFGTMGYTRFFFGPSKRYGWGLAPLKNRQPGDVPVISAKTWYEADFRSLLDNIPPDVPEFYFAYYHEPEDNILSGALTAESHAATYRRARAIRDSHPNGRRCRLVTIMFWYAITQRRFDWHRLAGSIDASDVVAMDLYTLAASLKKNVYTSSTELFAPILTVTAETKKPWAVPEFGVKTAVDGDPDRRAEAIIGHIDTARANGALWMSYWCNEVGGDNFHLEAAGSEIPLIVWRTATRATAIR